MVEITSCPSCGNNAIQKVRKDYSRTFRGQEYTVSDLTFFECPDCHERIFDRTAMRKIQACSPAFDERSGRVAA